jgi:geranylgeranyl pyrophosphate synthase
MLSAFEEYLQNNPIKVESFHPSFEETLNKMLNVGGKRFRPLLLLSVVEAIDERMLQNSYAVALALECLHTYSLIHDDLPCMDDSPLRRGHPTLHTLYGDAAAVLAGDALNTHAFYLISTAKLSAETKVALMRILSSDGGVHGMVLGQAIDLFFEQKKLLLPELKFLHIHKTAKLIAASLAMGAVISCAKDDLQEKLYNFGIKLGLFFQVRDDLLDALSDEEKEGKKVQNDGVKNSFVNLLGIDGAKEEFTRLKNELEYELKEFKPKLFTALNSVCDRYFKEDFKGE